MSEPLRVISLGWGVQSFALAAMSALGVLPKVDAAVHADTTHERSETYAFAAKWTPWLEERGVRVVTVQARLEVVKHVFSDDDIAHPPFYTVSPDGEKGQMRRFCTDRWKIRPIRAWLRAELKRRGLKKTPGVVESWLGITRDEWQRMKDSDVLWSRNVYPFMDFDPPWKRSDVSRWLRVNGLEVPVKSSCVFCPFHGLNAWREIQQSGNGDWGKAVEVDRAIRNKRPGFESFVCRSHRPLEETDLRNAQDHGQLTLWDEEECTGTCFL